MKRGSFLLMFFCAGVVFPATLTLSLEDAIDRGIENSLSLKKSLIDLSTAEYSAGKLWSEVFPTISAGLGASYSSSLFSGGGFQASRDNGSFNANLGVSLTLNAGIPYAIKNIELAYQTQLLSYEDARNQLEIQLTKSFYGLIADRDNLIVLADILNLTLMQYERNQVAFRNGVIGELTLLQSRLSMENAHYNMDVAQVAYVSRMSDFLEQIGFAHDADVVLEGKIETAKLNLDADSLILQNLPRRPDIVSMRYEIERLENVQKQTVNSARAPSLSLSTTWRSSDFSPFTDSLGGSATLSIPIDPWIPGTSRNKTIRNTHTAIDKARIDLQSASVSASAQIRSLAAYINNSWSSIEIARLSLAISERNYALAEQGFRAGTVESLRLENAQNDLAYARQRLLQSELSYFNMVLDISAALNISWKELMQ